MSDHDYDDETQLSVDVDDPDETKDRPRELAKAEGLLPAEAEGSTLMADPAKMKQLAKQAAAEAEAEPEGDEPASIVSFVSNVSVVTQSVDAPSPIGARMPAMPADAEPETMGSITLEPRSRAPADAEPETIEPRLGVRGIGQGPAPRSPVESDTGHRKQLLTEDVTTGSMDHADVLRAVASDPAAAARINKAGPPRPAAKAEPQKALSKRSKTVIGLAPPQNKPAVAPPVTPDPDPKEAETEASVNIGPMPATLPLPTTAMRARTNSDEALIANALAIPPTGSEFQPSTFQDLPDGAPPKTLAIPQTAPKPMTTTLPLLQPDGTPARPSDPVLPVQPDGPTPAGMSFVPLDGEPPKKSNAGLVFGLVVGGFVLLAAGTVLGWSLRSARIPASVAATAAPPPSATASSPASVASAEPEKKEPEAKSDPEPEKKPDVEAKNDPPPEKTDKIDTSKKPKTPPWKPAAAKPPPWKPPPPKPSAKPVPVPVPVPVPAPATTPKNGLPEGI